MGTHGSKPRHSDKGRNRETEKSRKRETKGEKPRDWVNLRDTKPEKGEIQ